MSDEALELEIVGVTSALQRISRKQSVKQHTNLLCVAYKECRGCPITRLPYVFNQRMCAGNEHAVKIHETGKELVTVLVNYKALLLDVRDNEDKSTHTTNVLYEKWHELYPKERK